MTTAFISSIVVPADRQRKDLGDIGSLAESIGRLGLINPITVTLDLILIAGERRLTACRQLGMDQIEVRYFEDLDDLTKHCIELEENIKRKDITWQEESEAIVAYHKLRGQMESDWTIVKTAAEIGVSRKVVEDRLMIEEEAKHRPQIKELPKLSEAKTASQRQRVRRDDNVIQAVEKSVAKSPVAAKVEEEPAVINTNFNLWAPTYTGPKFNFIHCDFPYGINLQNSDQVGSKEIGAYEDTPEVYWQLIETLCDNLGKVAAPSCHLMFWFSMTHYEETLHILSEQTDFIISPFPLIWLKSDNSGILPDPRRGPRRIYETAFFGYRGDRFIAQTTSNAYAAPSSREHHISEKSEPMLRYFFQMFVDKHTVMLDPTAGGGSSIRAAESLNAAYVQGLEINPEFAASANRSIELAKRKRNVTKG